jgi:hypothetical protein
MAFFMTSCMLSGICTLHLTLPLVAGWNGRALRAAGRALPATPLPSFIMKAIRVCSEARGARLVATAASRCGSGAKRAGALVARGWRGEQRVTS